MQDGTRVTLIGRVEDVVVNRRAARLVVCILEAASLAEKLQKVDIVASSGLGHLYKKASDLGKNDEIVISGLFRADPLSASTIGNITPTRIGVLARRTVKRDKLEEAISSF